MTAQKQRAMPSVRRRRTNKEKRSVVLTILKDLNESGENWSNCKIADRAKVSESLVRLIKSQIGFKPTSQIAKSKDGREISTCNIGSATKFRKKKKEEQRRKAESKREKLDTINEGTNLDTLIHKCPVCKNHFIGS